MKSIPMKIHLKHKSIYIFCIKYYITRKNIIKVKVWKKRLWKVKVGLIIWDGRSICLCVFESTYVMITMSYVKLMKSKSFYVLSKWEKSFFRKWVKICKCRKSACNWSILDRKWVHFRLIISVCLKCRKKGPF